MLKPVKQIRDFGVRECTDKNMGTIFLAGFASKTSHYLASLTWGAHFVNIYSKSSHVTVNWYFRAFTGNPVYDVIWYFISFWPSELSFARGHNMGWKARERLSILGRNSKETPWRDCWWWLTQRRPFSFKWGVFWEGNSNLSPPPPEVL